MFNQKNKNPYIAVRVLSDRDRIRTYDRLLRRQMLYPAELRDRPLRICDSRVQI